MPNHEKFSRIIGAVALIWAILFLLGLMAHGQSTAYLPPPEKFCRFDSNGDPLVGGKLYTYSAGTTTNKATYTDSTGGAANANPVVLDSSGCANVWLRTGAYKLKLTDANGTLLWTIDNVTASPPAWGAITGTLGNQTDLQAVLNTYIPLSYLDTDITLAANSNVRIASQKAVKAYAVPTSRTINTTAPITGGGGLTADRTIAISNCVGDSGSGGTKGAVPAPGANDTANMKFLRADCTFAPVTSGGLGIRAGTISSVCTTGASTYDKCASAMTLNWSTAFSDTTYKVTCTGVTPSNPRAGPIYIESKTTSGITVNFPTEGTVAVTYASIDCIAIP